LAVEKAREDRHDLLQEGSITVGLAEVIDTVAKLCDERAFGLDVWESRSAKCSEESSRVYEYTNARILQLRLEDV